MILDDYDLFLLKEFAKLKHNESTTTWKLMKKIYPNGKERENEKIKRRIERMANFNLFFIEGKPKTYTLNSDNVFFKKFNFPDKKSKALALKIDGKWEVYEI